MNLQEGEKAGVVLSPDANKARVIDLEGKVRCWIRHINIAEKNRDSIQIRVGGGRLRELKNQIGEGLKLWV